MPPTNRCPRALDGQCDTPDVCYAIKECQIAARQKLEPDARKPRQSYWPDDYAALQRGCAQVMKSPKN